MQALEARPWNPTRQCTGTNRAGERCQRQPHTRRHSLCESRRRYPCGAGCGEDSAAGDGRTHPRDVRGDPRRVASRHLHCCGHVDEHGNVLSRLRASPPATDARDPRRQLVLDRAGSIRPSRSRRSRPARTCRASRSRRLADRAEEYARLARDAADAEAARMLPPPRGRRADRGRHRRGGRRAARVAVVI